MYTENLSVMDIILNLSNYALGGYFVIAFVFGIVLLTGHYGVDSIKVNPLMRMVGSIMLVDALDVIITGFGSVIFPTCTFIDYFSLTLDCTSMILCFLAGFSLLSGNYPTLNQTLIVAIPILGSMLALKIGGAHFNTAFIVSSILCILYISHLTFCFIRHDINLRFQYSTTKNRHTIWYLPFLLLADFATPVIYSTMPEDWPLHIVLGIFYFIVTLIYLLLFYSVAHHKITTVKSITHTQELRLRRRVKGQEATPEQQDLLNKADHLMLEHKLYANPEFNIDHLSRKLGVPTENIYDILHELEIPDFREYVNGFRVAAAREMISRGVGGEEVAKSCGFLDYKALCKALKTAK